MVPMNSPFMVVPVTCDQLYRAISDDDLLCCTHCELFFDGKKTEPENKSGLFCCPACRKTNSVIVYEETHLADMVATHDGYRPCEHCDFAFFMTDAAGKGDGVYVCPKCGKDTT
jgi:hypothetical protein